MSAEMSTVELQPQAQNQMTVARPTENEAQSSIAREEVRNPRSSSVANGLCSPIAGFD